MKKAIIDAIIAAIDHELEKSGRTFLTAVETNALLAQMQLLPDYAGEWGRPLRKLLKAGAISHAYKVAGKTGQWVIPHSSTRRVLDKPYIQVPKPPNEQNK